MKIKKIVVAAGLASTLAVAGCVSEPKENKTDQSETINNKRVLLKIGDKVY